MKGRTCWKLHPSGYRRTGYTKAGEMLGVRNLYKHAAAGAYIAHNEPHIKNEAQWKFP